MKNNFITAVRLTLVCAVFFCGIYPLTIWGIAQLTPHQGKGDMVSQDGRTYYANVGQSFTAERYFWSRPSAVGYNAAGSAGSNKGPSNPAYLAEVQARIDTFLAQHPNTVKAQIPADLVTASGSGLDPNISVQAARVQVMRVANVRRLSEKTVQELVDNQTEKALFGLLGTERINVLKLNLALDKLK